MILLVGLGNPGGQYAGNRHNIGFMAIDAIHHRHDFGPWKRAFQGEIAEGKLAPAGDKVLLLKPLTYMNESGRAVGEAARFYKLDLAHIVVFHDELDLAAGRLKMKTGGGHAGHNGLRSLDAHIGPTYRRVRLGISHPGDKAAVLRYVLGDFGKSDNTWLHPLLDAVAQEAPLLARGEDAAFQSKVALLTAPPKPAKPPKAAPAEPSGE
ncbi:aminoacyl-tRNA hydrolase [Oleomonas cavernae]|uniref:Peptidyl-tRNA hydrolase n=1 Tax=Oleomonas cavernae TaxID=2320859 RepID=A0A418W9N9_9PROT|nr:aminoacyl-tRNA hydrolase [Oleomonas cavernae]RJF86730.1 aminoacyl-tRNA hydrolase [Oleomonas cavernae]